MQELDLHSIRPGAKSNSRSVSSTKTESTGAAVHRGASQPNLGQRYYILQNQRLLALLLYDPRPFLPQGHRLSGVPQRKHSSGHKHLPGRLSSTRQSHRADLSQRSRRTVYLSHAYGTAAKCGAKQSFSATARPHDNAVAEAFFASFKKRRRTAGSTPRSKATAKAWRNMSNSIMSCDPIGP